MFQICPKCAYARKADDTGPAEICPSCGLVYAKYNDASAKRARSALDTRNHRKPRGTGGRLLVKLLLLVALIAGASYLYRIQHPRLAHSPTDAVNLPVLPDANGTSSQREFVELFEAGTPFSALATRGQYTVVEVYLDQCSYCRELEAGMTPLKVKRNDLGIVRVHHPGSINNRIQASSREELEAKMASMNQRMADYQLCGSPHVEIYGPDKEPIALDTCKSRQGTTFLWEWITSETGITRNSPAGLFTRM